MTRKKFIKMLMWAGMHRNDAADCATLAQEAGRPYFGVLGDLLNFHRPRFSDPLVWPNVRHTIIHGHDSPVTLFFERTTKNAPTFTVNGTNCVLEPATMPDGVACIYAVPLAGGGGNE